jgi:hypothetical protein
MCIGLIGGMDRLKQDYISTAKDSGCALKVFTGKEHRIADKLGQLDMLIMFTNKISHAARREVMAHARANNIPVQMLHSCGVSTLRQALNIR